MVMSDNIRGKTCQLKLSNIDCHVNCHTGFDTNFGI